jgi:hypothetical protein
LISALKAGANKPAVATPTAKPESVAQKPKPASPGQNKPVKIDPSKFPEEPEFISSIAANVAANKAAVAKLKDLITAGDLAAFQSFEVPPSPKLQAWKNEVATVWHDQLNPPKPPEPYNGCLSNLTKVYKNVKQANAAGAKKIGFYIVTEEPGVPEVSFPKVVYKMKGYASSGSYQMNDTKEQAKHTAAWKSLTATEQAAVKAYKGSSYGGMNAAMRTGTMSSSAFEKAKHVAKAILNKAPELPVGTFLQRGMGADEFGPSYKEQFKNSVGKVFQEPGVTSAAIGSGWGGQIKWHFTAGPGVKGLYVGNIPPNDGEAGGEMLLAPGQRYLVTKVEDSSGSGGIAVHAVLLASDPDQCC